MAFVFLESFFCPPLTFQHAFGMLGCLGKIGFGMDSEDRLDEID